MASPIDGVFRHVFHANVIDHANCRVVEMAARTTHVALENSKRSYWRGGILADLIVSTKVELCRLTFDAGGMKKFHCGRRSSHF